MNVIIERLAWWIFCGTIGLRKMCINKKTTLILFYFSLLDSPKFIVQTL